MLPSARTTKPVTAPASALAKLSPAYFGMVMATGIVSLAANMRGFPVVAHSLFFLNTFLYVLLWGLYCARLCLYKKRFLEDLQSHLTATGFFTVVAATNVLGSQFLILISNIKIAIILFSFGILLWLLLTYFIFTIFTIKEEKPSLDKGISGGWLLAVVATQSIAVLSALIAANVGQPWQLELNFFALSMWLWGGMLYIWMMSLIFYRYAFFRFSPDDLSPPYWINMGAMAISTLAGSLLILNAPDAPFLLSMLAFIKGFTIFYWATGTWWIPMLLLLGVWRYIYKRFPFEYDPLYWGAVFPLGMYAACTHELALAMNLHFLTPLPSLFLFIALMAWSITFLGASKQAYRAIRY